MKSQQLSTMNSEINSLDVIMLGDAQVGKTTLATRASKNTLPRSVPPTIAIQYHSFSVNVKNQVYHVKCWDTSGHKKYRKHIPQYLGKAQAAVIVFDVNKYATYHWAKQWVHEIRELEQEKEMQEQIPILLFGNKTDICPAKWSQMSQLREVKQNIARQYAEENQLLYGEGCALADDSFLEGLSSLIKSHFLPNEVILEGKQESKNCCC